MGNKTREPPASCFMRYLSILKRPETEGHAMRGDNEARSDVRRITENLP